MKHFASTRNLPEQEQYLYDQCVELLDAREVKTGWERAREYARGLAEGATHHASSGSTHPAGTEAPPAVKGQAVALSASPLFSFCIDCGGLVEEALARLGSLRCHDCAHPIDKRAA